MKRFEFRFETLAQLRQREEEKCQLALAESTQKLILAQQDLKNIEDERHALDDAWAKSMDGDFAGGHAAQDFERYRTVLEQRLDAAHTALREARRLEHAARKKLNAAMKKRKILDKLRERHHRAYLDELNRQEAKELEEMAISKFIRAKDDGEQGL